tara:strand:+ start:237 stop:830 length:594 start_codon:yes stop_codon:yes gene_type:complete
MSGFTDDLSALTNMLASAEKAAEARDVGTSSSDSSVKSSTSIVTPGSIVPSNKKKAITNGDAANNNTKATRDPDAIWGQEEIDGHDPDFDDDGRVIPDYDILYKQQVGTEDTMLGMSGKTPLTSDCNYMVLLIKMPGSQLKNIDLTVEKQKIVVHDPTYRLATYLPYVAKDKEGKAQWIHDSDTLRVTLPIDRQNGF